MQIDQTIHKPPALLTVGFLLMAILLRGIQLDSNAQPGELPEPPRNEDRPCHEVPARRPEINSFAPVVEKVAPAVVRIVTAFSGDSDATGKVQDPLQRYLLEQLLRSRRSLQAGLGSGVIVTEDGYILTNGHLVNGMNEIQVTLQDGREFKGRVIGLDAVTDIAVVKIAARQLPTVLLAESGSVRVGDVVLAIGHPFGVGQTVTHGIVSATDRGGLGIEDYESFIQTDAPINPGNSGGPLVDVTGQLIGINTAILSSSGGNVGIGFAVPSDLARRVMTDLVKHGRVIRGYLGVETQDLTPGLAQEFKLHGASGVLVGGVVNNGPAERAGLKVGDVITRFDGKVVRDARQLKFNVAESKPGETIAVEVLRDGSASPLLALRITIAQDFRNDLLARLDRSDYEKDSGALEGVTIGELNSQLRQQLQIPRHVQGAVILGINPFSVAAAAGLKPGDVIQSVNRQDVANAGEASRLTQECKDKHALLRVWSSGASHFVLVED